MIEKTKRRRKPHSEARLRRLVHAGWKPDYGFRIIRNDAGFPIGVAPVLTHPLASRSKYRPHQGKREIARRLATV